MLKYICIIGMLILAANCQSDESSSSSEEQQKTSAELSAELPPSCVKVQAKIFPDLKRLGGFWYKFGGLPFNVTPNYPCETMLNVYNEVDNTLHTTAQHFINKTSPRTTDWLVTIRLDNELNPRTTDVLPVNVVMPYWRVLNSDYATYAIIYACTDVKDYYDGTIIWIISRYRKYRQDVVDTALKQLADMGIVRDDWQYNTSRDC